MGPLACWPATPRSPSVKIRTSKDCKTAVAHQRSPSLFACSGPRPRLSTPGPACSSLRLSAHGAAKPSAGSGSAPRRRAEPHSPPKNSASDPRRPTELGRPMLENATIWPKRVLENAVDTAQIVLENAVKIAKTVLENAVAAGSIRVFRHFQPGFSGLAVWLANDPWSWQVVEIAGRPTAGKRPWLSFPIKNMQISCAARGLHRSVGARW